MIIFYVKDCEARQDQFSQAPALPPPLPMERNGSSPAVETRKKLSSLMVSRVPPTVLSRSVTILTVNRHGL